MLILNESLKLMLMFSEIDVELLRKLGVLEIDLSPELRINKLILTLTNTDEDSINKVLDAGLKFEGNILCKICNKASKLIDNKCVVCWAAEAKKLMIMRN